MFETANRTPSESTEEQTASTEAVDQKVDESVVDDNQSDDNNTDLISDASKEAAPTEADAPDVTAEPTVEVKLNQEWYDAGEFEGDVTVSTAAGTYVLSAEPLELPASEAELVLSSPAAEIV